MLSLQIAGQGRLFLCGIIAGMGLLFVYDMFRVWRRVISHGTLWIAIEDIFYWCGSAIGLFLLFYQLNDGQIRVFFLLAAFVGMCLYHKGISPGFLKAGTAVLGSLVKGIRFIGKGLFYPIIFRVKKIRQRHYKKRKRIENEAERAIAVYSEEDAEKIMKD